MSVFQSWSRSPILSVLAAVTPPFAIKNKKKVLEERAWLEEKASHEEDVDDVSKAHEVTL